MFENVAHWILHNKIEELIKDTYSLAFTKGYGLGRKAGLAESKNRICILGGINIQREVEEILEKEGF